jgi:cytochrome P450
VVATRVEIPKIPTRVPFIGHFLDLIVGTPWTTMMRWAHVPGRVASFGLFGETYVMVADPELLRRVLATNVTNYRKDDRTYAAFKPILGNGLIISEGELWKRQRAILGRAFRADILGHMVAIAAEAADRLIAELDVVAGKGVPFDFAPAFRRLTLQVIADAVLSLPPHVSDEVFPKLYLPIVDEANLRTWMPFRAYLPTPGNLEFRRACEELDRYVTELIRDRREKGSAGPKDILQRIMIAHDESGQPWDEAAVAQLRDEVKTFLMAGHETSSMMLTWALFELARHPAIMERVIAEADATLPLDGPIPEQQAEGAQRAERAKAHGHSEAQASWHEHALKGLAYTEAVLKETLRRYSIVPVVTREAVEDDMLGGYAIPKGTKIVVAIDAVHHDPEVWKDPHDFRPERFLEPLPHPYAFLAFLAGPRNCIGEHFSLIEGKIVLARLVQRFRFLVASKAVGERHKFKAPVAPKDPMHLFVEEHPRVRS